MELKGRKKPEDREHRITSFIVLFSKYFYGKQMKEDEMARICSTRGRHDKCIQNLIIKPEGKRALW
jgi:hypothetical protein